MKGRGGIQKCTNLASQSRSTSINRPLNRPRLSAVVAHKIAHQIVFAAALKNKKQNRSPKGNMWSAIPVALLRLLVIVGDGKQGSGLEGDDVL